MAVKQKNCFTCDGYACSSCIQGYYLTPLKKCSKCLDSNCIACPYDVKAQGSICRVCQTGYYLHLSTNMCISCKKNVRGGNCAQCEYKLLSDINEYRYNCLLCQNGYGLILQDNTCTICSLDNCVSCVYDSLLNKRTCINCDQGYYLENDGKCVYCGLSNCINCSISANNQYLCNSCKIGYYINTANQCQSCMNNIAGCGDCAIDSNRITCKQCLSPLYYLSNGTCILCTTATMNCLGCLENNDQVLCTNCQEGYYLRNPLNCSKCLINNCSLCSAKDSGKSCNICEKGYYLSSAIKCELCSSSIANCMSCVYKTNLVQCNICDIGYYLYENKQNTSCLKCSINCDYCVNSSLCNSCSEGYYKQIDKNGRYCYSKTCSTPNNIDDPINKTCTACSFTYENCSTCNAVQCKTCISNQILMVPSQQYCTFCNDTYLTKINEGICAYFPNIDQIDKTNSVKTGNTTINISCGSQQIFRIYATYFTYIPVIKEYVQFSSVYKYLQNLSNSTNIFISAPVDIFWSVYMAILTDSSGSTSFMISGLKNVGINYRLQAWCLNFGTKDYPLNIISNMTSVDWYQSDNLGVVFKLNLKTAEILSNSSKSLIAQVLSQILNLESMKRYISYNIFDSNITDNGTYEIFFIERDLTIAPIDTTTDKLMANLTNIRFINNLNAGLQAKNANFSIIDLKYDTLNSSIQNVRPEFKSNDFTRILVTDDNSANFSLEIINTNGFIYIGFINRTDSGNVGWENLVKGTDNNGNALNAFEKVYVKIFQPKKWLWNGLAPGQGYTIYYAATNEDKFVNTQKTQTYRVVFRTYTL